jgi:hypothetical protein
LGKGEKKMPLILGLKGTGGWHNSGVCLIDSEKDDILFASEAFLERRKHRYIGKFGGEKELLKVAMA